MHLSPAPIQSLAFSSCTMLLSNMSAATPAERRQRANAGDAKVSSVVDDTRQL